MRVTCRRVLTTAGVAGLGLAAGRPFAHAQAARPITVAHSVPAFDKPYMDTCKREDVLKSVRYYRTIFDWDFLIDETDYDNGMKVFIPLAIEKPVAFARAVDLSFVRKARTKYKS